MARHAKMAKYRSSDDQDNGANEEKSWVIIAIIDTARTFLQTTFSNKYLIVFERVYVSLSFLCMQVTVFSVPVAGDSDLSDVFVYRR